MTAPVKTLSQQLAAPQDDIACANALDTLIKGGSEAVQRFVKARAPLEHVEDICADTWEAMIKHVKAGDYKDRGDDPIGYVLGIARFLSLRYSVRQQRAQQHEVALDETFESAIEDVGMNSEEEADIASLRRALSDPEDQAVLQALLDEQTINDMARAWNCHYKTAWRRFHRFLDHSRDVLGDAAIPAQFIAQRG